ncbi:MAG: WbqC family protein [Sulfolobales archaeon]|nr:WbqC family protein [Sulfolobales archaeon]MCX8208029.1 WbqC family protein [Sulfolobales archaeon]
MLEHQSNPQSSTSKQLTDKAKWIEKIVKSAKQSYKLCPYFDKKTNSCFVKMMKSQKKAKCDREGKFDTCPVFAEFIGEQYDKLVALNRVLPQDFRDLQLVI